MSKTRRQAAPEGRDPNENWDSPEFVEIEELTEMLRQRGLPGASGQAVAERVGDSLAGLPSEALGLVLDGIALGVSFPRASEFPEDQLDSQVLNQLVGDFSRELGKLDEILRVLNAYLQRLGGGGPADGGKCLQ